MTTMDRAARSELLQTVQAQEEKIKRYEARLRDLVVAYRTLTKEKATLEETVKALTVSKDTAGNVEQRSDEGDTASQEASDLRRRVEALSQSLAALTEEKRQMESSYVSDRKKLIKDQEDALQALRRELDSAEIVRRELQRENGDQKARLREQRLQAERADADQACMLRELQSLLTKERSAREQLEFEAEELRERLATAEAEVEAKSQAVMAAPVVTTASSDAEAHQRCIRDLRNEVEQLRGRQSATEAPLEELQAEMLAMKAEHRVQLHRELQRANEAEHRLAEFTQQHEERVCSLEARLTELSQMLGSYERTREADQAAIMKLRDRITQLDLENSALAANGGRREGREKSPESGCSADSLEEEEEEKEAIGAGEEEEEVEHLVERISELKTRLKLANAKASRPVDLGAIFAVHESNLHRACREEYEQLKEEYERYKLKAQSVLMKQQALSARSVGAAGPGGVSLLSKEEAERLQHQVSRLKERARDLQEELANEERVNKRAQAALRRSAEEKATAHARELETARRQAEQRVSEFGEELTRLRNRTLALLAEKDEEIAVLRSGAGGAGRAQALLTAASMNALLHQNAMPGALAVTVPLEEASTSVSSPSLASCSLIHCQQERARLGAENRQLREANRSLEAELREARGLTREAEEHAAELERAERLRQSNARAAAAGALDLEYLKNVVLRYATTADAESKRTMLRAIATILHFSPKEINRVEQYNSTGWFSAGR